MLNTKLTYPLPVVVTEWHNYIVYLEWLFLVGNLIPVANSGYFTVFTPHIYFIILISMNAGHLVERLDFQRYRAENVFGSLISTRLDRLPLVSTQGFFSSTIFEIFSSILAYHIFVLLLVVVFFHYEIYCCQYHEPLCNIKKTNWSMTLAIFSWVATKLQSAYVLAKGGWAYVNLSSLTR